ncbi:hypothetical protein JL09_g6699 [Pichia kudriavzevii]|uniref:Uncharacterized protein n=1 Tax=Pichia kudriavzevii TaxID=4909 RepID=A0A099NKR9_PICKU|nr:hypothetical protein JL09_g6699 [Pichia kudriavzevii]
MLEFVDSFQGREQLGFPV